MTIEPGGGGGGGPLPHPAPLLALANRRPLLGPPAALPGGRVALTLPGEGVSLFDAEGQVRRRGGEEVSLCGAERRRGLRRARGLAAAAGGGSAHSGRAPPGRLPPPPPPPTSHLFFFFFFLVTNQDLITVWSGTDGPTLVSPAVFDGPTGRLVAAASDAGGAGEPGPSSPHSLLSWDAAAPEGSLPTLADAVTLPVRVATLVSDGSSSTQSKTRFAQN
jgi:hypothetical protein